MEHWTDLELVLEIRAGVDRDEAVRVLLSRYERLFTKHSRDAFKSGREQQELIVDLKSHVIEKLKRYVVSESDDSKGFFAWIDRVLANHKIHLEREYGRKAPPGKVLQVDDLQLGSHDGSSGILDILADLEAHELELVELLMASEKKRPALNRVQKAVLFGIRRKLAFLEPAMKLRIQVGAESYVNGRRVARLTPFDQTVEVPDIVGMLLLVSQRELDAKDDQPGDGEVDLPIGQAFDDVVSKIPQLKPIVELLPGEENLFVRLRAV